MSGKWNYEICTVIAQTFETKRDFRAKENLAYQWLLRNGLLNTACAHMRPLLRSLTDEGVAAIAAKYSSRKAFNIGDRSAYSIALRRGILDKVCAHMELSPRYSYTRWNRGSVFDEAAKYKSRAEFKRCNAGAYEFALSNGLLDQACAHMRDGKRFWHVFELMSVAIKYSDWSEFIKLEPQAYNFAKMYKLTCMASAHMSKSRITWTKELVLAEAAKHQARGLFQLSVAGAYKHADQHGYLDEACAHMPPPEYGFSKEKPAVLYHLRITTLDGLALYKIGITNRDPVARIAGMGLPDGVSAEVLDAIRFNSGRDARIAEKRLHRKYAAHRYNGPQVMKNGNTELFTVSVLEL